MLYTAKNTINIGKPVKVFVDGIEIENAVEADTDEGYVVFMPAPIRTCHGQPDQIYTETVRGTVTVEPA